MVEKDKIIDRLNDQISELEIMEEPVCSKPDDEESKEQGDTDNKGGNEGVNGEQVQLNNIFVSY